MFSIRAESRTAALALLQLSACRLQRFPGWGRLAGEMEAASQGVPDLLPQCALGERLIVALERSVARLVPGVGHLGNGEAGDANGLGDGSTEPDDDFNLLRDALNIKFASPGDGELVGATADRRRTLLDIRFVSLSADRPAGRDGRSALNDGGSRSRVGSAGSPDAVG